MSSSSSCDSVIFWHLVCLRVSLVALKDINNLIILIIIQLKQDLRLHEIGNETINMPKSIKLLVAISLFFYIYYSLAILASRLSFFSGHKIKSRIIFMIFGFGIGMTVKQTFLYEQQ